MLFDRRPPMRAHWRNLANTIELVHASATSCADYFVQKPEVNRLRNDRDIAV